MMPPPRPPTKGIVVPPRNAPRTPAKTIAARPPATARPAQFDPATDPLQVLVDQTPKTFPGQLLQEVNKKEEGGTPPAARQLGGRGARPNRPCQKARETGRSFERLADRLLKAQEAEFSAKNEVAELKSELARRDTELAEMTQLNAELKKANTQLDIWNRQWKEKHDSMVASLPDAGQWKMMYEVAEKGRADLQASMHTMQTDNREAMEKMSEEIKAREEARRRELNLHKIEQLKAKDRELTNLREELLQKEAQLKAMASAKSAPEAGTEPELSILQDGLHRLGADTNSLAVIEAYLMEDSERQAKSSRAKSKPEAAKGKPKAGLQPRTIVIKNSTTGAWQVPKPTAPVMSMDEAPVSVVSRSISLSGL